MPFVDSRVPCQSQIYRTAIASWMLSPHKEGSMKPHISHQIPITKFSTRLCLAVATFLVTATSVFAQDPGSITKALLALRTLNGNVSTVNGRLYGGSIDSTIRHLGGNVNEVAANDALALTVTDRNGKLPPVTCGTSAAPMNKARFDECVQQNVNALIQILFPTSLSMSVSGRDMAQDHSQLFLVTTALGLATPNAEARRRSDIGGLV